MHRARDLHPGGLPVRCRPPRRPRAVRRQLADQRARSLQAPRTPVPPPCRSAPGRSYYLPLVAGADPPGRSRPPGRSPHLDRDAHEEHEASRLRRPGSTACSPRRARPSRRAPSPSPTRPTKAGFCKLYGIRYQLDNGGIDYKQFLGKPLDVIVTVTDPSGTSATTTARIQVAPTLVNPMKPFTAFSPSGSRRRSARSSSRRAFACSPRPPPPEPARAPEWQLLASELPSALLSVSGRSPRRHLRRGRRQGPRAARPALRRQGAGASSTPARAATSGGCRRSRTARC